MPTEGSQLLDSRQTGYLVIDSSGSSAIVSSALEDNFVALLPKDSKIERVYWAFEKNILRIWTIVDRPDFEFEKNIYNAQLKFMEYFSDFTDMEFDFSVLYRFGKNIEDLRPITASQVHPPV